MNMCWAADLLPCFLFCDTWLTLDLNLYSGADGDLA